MRRLLLLVILSACAHKSSSTTKTIGAAGGTVTASDGAAKLVIPAGALAHDVAITLTKAKTPPVTSDANVDVATAYVVTSPTVDLAIPAEIHLPRPAAKTPARAASIARDAQSIACQTVFQDQGAGTCWYPGSTIADCPAAYPVLYGFNPTFTYKTFSGPAVFCGSAPTPNSEVVFINDLTTYLPVTNDPTEVVGGLSHLGNGAFATASDTQAPRVALTVVPTVSGEEVTLTLQADATDAARDNPTLIFGPGFHPVDHVQFYRIDSIAVDDNGNTTTTSTPLGEAALAPFIINLPAAGVSDALDKVYGVLAFDAAGNIGSDFRYVARPKPVVNAFTPTPSTLGPLGGAVTLAWQVSNADTISIDQGIGDVTGHQSATAHITATTTFTLSATNSAGTTTAQVIVSVMKTDDIYVDVNVGDDAHSGLLGAPVKTITKALTLVKPNGTVYLYDGAFTYQNEGASPPVQLEVPDTVTIRAINPRAATITGIQLNFSGSNGAIYDVHFSGEYGFIATHGSNAGTLLLSGIEMEGGGNSSLYLRGPIATTLSPGSLSGSYSTVCPSQVLADLGSGASLTVTGGSFLCHGEGNPPYAMFTVVSASLTLDGVTVSNFASRLIGSQTAGTIVLKNGTVVDNVGAAHGRDNASGIATIALSGTPSLLLDASSLTHIPGQGIFIGAGSTATVTLQNGALVQGAGLPNLQDAGTGILAENGTAVVDLSIKSNSSVSGNGTNLFLFAGTLDADHAHIDGAYGNGIQLNDPYYASDVGSFTMKMRNSTLKNIGSTPNSVGLSFYSPVQLQAYSIDLGTAADPGGNFLQNSGLGILINTASVFTIDAAGNTWRNDATYQPGVTSGNTIDWNTGTSSIRL